MTEPFVPVPGPEAHSNWEPERARCAECNEIVAVRPDGSGWCPSHGIIEPVFPSDYQTDNDEERDDDA